MLIKDFLPNTTLSDFVQCYRIVDFKFPPGSNVPVKIYPPKPEHCLHFFLRDFFAVEKDDNIIVQPTALITGIRTHAVKQYTGHNFIDVQIVFQPTTLHLLTGINLNELTNQHLDARNIFPGKVDDLLSRLQHANSYSDKIAELEKFVIALIAKTKRSRLPVDTVCLDVMRQRRYGLSMENLASAACLSEKQFYRKFTERTGVNPKTFLRIARFNKAYNCRNRFPSMGWSALTEKCGYVDYQHLTKDYKNFTGTTAFEFHLLENEAPENILNLSGELYVSRYKNFCQG